MTVLERISMAVVGLCFVAMLVAATVLAWAAVIRLVFGGPL